MLFFIKLEIPSFSHTNEIVTLVQCYRDGIKAVRYDFSLHTLCR